MSIREQPIASVIIPAHNEEAVIGRCLSTMLEGAMPGELEVVVVCNGCTDKTVEIARSFGPDVNVVELGAASKCKAWNIGNATAKVFPRLYVDADVMIPLASIRAVADELRSGPALAAAPRIRIDTSNRKWLVRAFYDIWTQLPYVTVGMVGAGVFALSEEGCKRVGDFPEVYADDEYVRLHFDAAERKIVDRHEFVVTPPDNFADLLKIKTRARFFKYLFREQFPELMKRDRQPNARTLPKLAKQIQLWPKLTVYLFAVVWTRVKAYWRYQHHTTISWDRDESARREAARLSNQQNAMASGSK